MADVGASAGDPYLLQANLDNTVSKIMEMEEQIERQVEEIERLEVLVNESDMLHDMESELERASGIEILSVSHNFLEMRITTYVPTMQAVSPNHRGKYEHDLTIALDTAAMTIEAVQLIPEDIPYEDLVAEAKAMTALHEAPLLVNGEGWSRQIPSLISRIRHRIYANVLKSASLTVSAKDPRYKLKYSPEANLIVATLPGPVTANIEAPYGWPMPGFALRLNSLVPSAKAHYLGSVDMLQQCVDLANTSPESQRSGVVQFLEAIEKILVVKRWEASSQL
ncbi:uncharacterized protein [Physcomitrium patens]|uniref:Uncharacterized protein n=1 Tax=Physcomitrium patens TaxID=3218 RepID=A0A2K1JS70_PHYPA|nr:uncharacterized protein LOC112289391 isoform X1 [Physcomitrium patens]PNR44385.1 hypothetical protein PHYPA_016769 [Physcomitrium patens]|eukprot:XP_024390331.1 uncharacterized protein LOC112289391 isoform X1 [Physcomitrella patens]